jgi:hypothetical protein
MLTILHVLEVLLDLFAFFLAATTSVAVVYALLKTWSHRETRRFKAQHHRA